MLEIELWRTKVSGGWGVCVCDVPATLFFFNSIVNMVRETEPRGKGDLIVTEIMKFVSYSWALACISTSIPSWHLHNPTLCCPVLARRTWSFLSVFIIYAVHCLISETGRFLLIFTPHGHLHSHTCPNPRAPSPACDMSMVIYLNWLA